MTFHALLLNFSCDPLSENPAHCAFYENRDKTGNRYTSVYCAAEKKIEVIVCLVPKLQSEMRSGCGTQLFETMFLRRYGKF